VNGTYTLALLDRALADAARINYIESGEAHRNLARAWATLNLIKESEEAYRKEEEVFRRGAEAFRKKQAAFRKKFPAI
jgi:hypothetical protein